MWWVALVALSLCAHAQFNQWTPYTLSIPTPSPRVFFGWAVGSAAGQEYLIVIGGTSGYGTTNLGEVPFDAWVLQVGTWEWAQINEIINVNFGFGFAATASPANSSAIIYVHGGTGGQNGLTPLEFFYTFDLASQSWSEPIAANNTPVLYMHTMSAVGTGLLIFGGLNVTGMPTGDLWWYDITSPANTWQLVAVDEQEPAPSPRSGHSAAVSGGSLVVVGGCFSTFVMLCPEPAFDVWLFTFAPGQDGAFGTWVALTAAPVGGQRPFVLNSLTSELYAFGSNFYEIGTPIAVFAMLPEPGAMWGPRSADPLFAPPPQRFMGAAAWLNSTGSILFFGGKTGFMSFGGADVCLLVPRGTDLLWAQNLVRTLPPARVGGSVTTVGSQIIMFGGGTSLGDGPTLNDMWVVNPAVDAAWEPVITPLLTPPTRENHFAAPLSAFSMLIFGGFSMDIVNCLNDVWVLNNIYPNLYQNWAWTNISAAAGPIPQPRQAAACGVWTDAAGSQKLVVFSGLPPRSFSTPASALVGTPFDDLWIFDIARRVWTQVAQGHPAPPARYFAVFGMVAGRFVVCCGYGSNATLPADVWSLDLTTLAWTTIPTAPTGPGLTPFVTSVASSHSVLPGGLKLLVQGGFNVQQGIVDGFVPQTAMGEFLGDAWNWIVLSTQYQPTLMLPMVTLNTEILGSSQTSAFLFGDLMQAGLFQMSMSVLNFTLGCPPGYASPAIATAPCLPCPPGAYAPTLGSSACSRCPAQTTTTFPAMSSEYSCNICQPGLCSHGTCAVSGSFEVSCTCQPGYSGQACDVNDVGIALGSLFGGLALLAIIGFVSYKAYYRMRAYRTDLSLKENLLETTKFELAALERAMSIHPAEIVRSRLVDAGAFGEVWQGEYQDRPVAIKQLRAALQALDESAADDFEREVQLLRRLRHRNIVFFYGAGLLDGVPFLVTEFMARGSLKKILYGPGEVPWPFRLSALQDTAAGMEYLHRQQPPTIHRDLKSGNLLVTDAWVVKVCDLGTARFCTLVAGHRDQRELLSGSREMTRGVGTLLWTAPEVLAGRDYGPSVDVYSFGIVMYEVLTRTMPYGDLKHTWDVSDAVARGVRPEVPAGCPVAYAALMVRCWDSEPVVRPPFSAVREALIGVTAPDA
eukprot:m.167502 g.167502  ORF g.167502 m.167502 type:complete len:1136 (+) comp9904_c0_seq2:40-3447(+)